MAQTGYTPISIYYSSTAGNTPTAGNLVPGELAINTADGKLFYKDSAGVVQVIAGKGGAGVAGGSNTQVQYNSSGSLAGSSNMTFDGTKLTVNAIASTNVITAGTGLISNGSLYVTAAAAPTGASGPALFGGYSTGATTAFIQGYNSTTSAWIPMNIAGSVVTFGTGASATERMRIESDGNVLIGSTTNDGYKLKVVGGNAANMLIDNGGQQYTQLLLQRNGTANTGGDVLIDGTNAKMNIRYLAVGAMTFQTSASAGSPVEAMRITSAGDVGIGTSSPTQPVELVKSTNAATWMSVVNTNSGSGAAAGYLMTNNTGVLGALQLNSSNNTTSGTTDAVVLRTLSTNPLIFATNATERMRINSSGNIGIGVTPSAWATVVPAMQFTGGGFIASQGSANTFYVGNNHYYDGTNFIYTSNGYATQYQSGGGSGNHLWYTAPSGTAGTTATMTERMRIDNNGNLYFNSGYGSSAIAYGCRAWVNFNGTGTISITGSGNISSLADIGVGDYRVNLSNAMPTTTFSCQAMAGNSGSAAGYAEGGPNGTGQVYVYTLNRSGSLADFTQVQFAIIR